MTRTRNTVLALVVVSLALMLWDLRASDQGLRAAAQQVVAPLQRTASAVFAPFGAWARDVHEYGDPVARSAQAARIEVIAPAGWTNADARVVAADIAGDRAFVTIDAGRSDGVSEGNAVLAPGGLIGEVTQVSARSASVRLVSDPASAIGVRVQTSKEIGVAQGLGVDSDLRVDLLSPAAPVATGDQILTLGSTKPNGIPPDVPVGEVVAVDTESTASGRMVEVAPVAGMSSLELVVVLTEQP